MVRSSGGTEKAVEQRLQTVLFIFRADKEGLERTSRLLAGASFVNPGPVRSEEHKLLRFQAERQHAYRRLTTDDIPWGLELFELRTLSPSMAKQ